MAFLSQISTKRVIDFFFFHNFLPVVCSTDSGLHLPNLTYPEAAVAQVRPRMAYINKQLCGSARSNNGVNRLLLYFSVKSNFPEKYLQGKWLGIVETISKKFLLTFRSEVFYWTKALFLTGQDIFFSLNVVVKMKY